MVTPEHTAINVLFRNRCELAAELLPRKVAARLDGLAPESAPAEVAQIRSAEHRADSVTIYRNEQQRVRFAVIVEVQHTTDRGKRWTWPHYVAAVRVRYRCPTLLLVIALDAPVARWARSVISLGHPGFELRPLVVSASEVPIIERAATVKRIPELAVLSALAHKSLPVAEAALAGVESLPDEESMIYADAILRTVPALVQRTMENEMIIQGYKIQSEFFLKLFARYKREGRTEGRKQGMKKGWKEGMAEGKARGKQDALVELVRARLGECSVEHKRAIRAISDEAELVKLLAGVARARDVKQTKALIDRALAAAPRAPRAGARQDARDSRRAA